MTVILGIETSCDETAAAVVVDGEHIESNVVASQVELHAQYGGIFPEMASRAHIEQIGAVIQQAIKGSGRTLNEIDAIAVTRGPGLAGSLVVGVNAAKGLALGAGLPLIPVNHIEGHIYSLWIRDGQIVITPEGTDPPDKVSFPAAVLIVSGGHTELLLMSDHGQYQRLGGTYDDAAGEAFDKVGRLLGLPYPGGPSIQKAGQAGNPSAFDFPRVWLRGDHGESNNDFSFSGLKTAMLRTLQGLQRGYKPGDPLDETVPVADLAASFQEAVVDVLVGKTVQAAQGHGAREIWVAGGVSANTRLRALMAERAPVVVRIPPLALCTDNAAMIAAAGHFRFLAEGGSPLDFDVLPNWPLTDHP